MSDVICANCREVYYETNGKFDPDKVTNATMLTMKEPYKSEYMWEQFPPDDSVIMDQLACPGCGAPMMGDDGKAVLEGPPRPKKEYPPAKVLEQVGIYKKLDEDFYLCTVCGKVCDTPSSRGGHTSMHVRNGDIPEGDRIVV